VLSTQRPKFLSSAIRLASCAVFLFGATAATHAQWLNYPTPGIPRTSAGKANLAAPAPKMPDGKPDFSGIWTTDFLFFRDLSTGLKPGDVQMMPWAKDLQHERETNDHVGDPMADCMPPGVPRIDTSNEGAATHPFKIVQTPSLVVLLYETSSYSTFRQVFLDGRPLPKDPQPTWLGYSVGHWEGNTLVVETTGFNGRAWLDTFMGHPQTDAGKVIERFTRRDFGHMELDVTIDDPKAYTKAWTVKIPAVLQPDTDLIETVCENAKKTGQPGK
jgi:hypothetical protein